MEALEQLRTFVDQNENNYAYTPDGEALYLKHIREGVTYSFHCCEEKYGWVAITCPLFFEKVKKSIAGFDKFRTLAYEMFGSRILLSRQGNGFYIIGKIRPEPSRIGTELGDFSWACSELLPAIQMIAGSGRWDPNWEGALFSPSAVGHA